MLGTTNPFFNNSNIDSPQNNENSFNLNMSACSNKKFFITSFNDKIER